MIPNPHRYLDWLYATIHSRDEIEIQEFEILDQSAVEGRTSELYGRLEFWDGLPLEFEEALRIQSFVIVKVRYSHHCQNADDTLVFRYDTAPHFPDLPGFPEHKHYGNDAVPAPAPDLSEVLREIDQSVYPDSERTQEGS